MRLNFFSFTSQLELYRESQYIYSILYIHLIDGVGGGHPRTQTGIGDLLWDTLGFPEELVLDDTSIICI